MERKDLDDILHSTVAECHAKMELITDYLERFKIVDNRLVAPIHDIERCIDVMHHMMHEHGKGDESHV